MVLEQAINGLREKDNDLKAKIYIRQAVFEIWTGRYRDALEVLEKAREFFEASGDALKGRWHSQRGLVLVRLATVEQRTDYFDRAIIEFTAAIYHFEQAGHERYCGSNLNNLAMLLYQLGRYTEAHERLDRAEAIFKRHRDTGNIAQVQETRARVYDAEEIARLRACARIVMRRLSGLRLHDKNFSLYGALQELEAKFIEQALEEEGGSVTRAAKLLGISHPSLIKLLKNRHKSLLSKRTPSRRRMRSIIKKPKK